MMNCMALAVMATKNLHLGYKFLLFSYRLVGFLAHSGAMKALLVEIYDFSVCEFPQS